MERPIKVAISQGDARQEAVLTKVYALLVAAKLECRLATLLYQPDGFNQHQRQRVRGAGSHLDRWLEAIAVGFRFQYDVKRLTANTIGFTAWNQFAELQRLATVDLRPLIELRNNLAHGQWRYALTADGANVSPDAMRDLSALNFTGIRLKSSLADRLCDAIHELVVARDARRMNFDQHYNRILEIKRNLDVQDHNRWAMAMRTKYERGVTLRHRRGNIT